MNKLTDKILVKLGFERINVTAEESGNKPYHYYSLDLDENDCLISNASDECEIEGEFTVNLFNSELGICKTDSDVMILYKALKGEYLNTGSYVDFQN